MKKYGSLVLSFLALVFTFFLPGCSAGDVPVFLNQVSNMVGGWAPATAIVLTVIEFLIRIFPSANPTSLILVTSQILHALGNACEAISKFLDGLGLQNVKTTSSLQDKKA